MKKKKILLVGDTQVIHLIPIFKRNGWEVDVFEGSVMKYLKSRLFNILKWVNYDLIYIIGGFDINKNYKTKLLFCFNKHLVFHWIGTDVLRILDYYQVHKRGINEKCVNISGSPLLQNELASIGIKTGIVPIVPTTISFTALPMPIHHEVIAYIPETREEFYNMDIMKKLAQEHPSILFHVVANSGNNDNNKLSNIIYEGFLNSIQMKELYSRCSILFRYPKHDGLSMMLLEALGTGKFVLYKYKFPFVHTPLSDSFDEINKTFVEILNSDIKVNNAAIEYVNTNFSIEKQLERYKQTGLRI